MGERAKSPLMRDRNFLWLIGGGALSMLGDQFTLLALPWLVLKMTNDTLIVGTVLAVASLPRAVFMLVGGAIVDRTSSKRVLMITKYANTALLALLAVLVYQGALTVWSVHLMALAIGLTSAFSFPAGTAIMPQVVAPELLQSANGMMMGIRQVSLLVGPSIAGIMIALFGDGSAGLGPDAAGVALAFAADSASFAVSAWTLSHVSLRDGVGGEPAGDGVLKAIAVAMRALWADKLLRALCLYYAASSFLIGGPLQVALPTLAERNLSQGAEAYGSLMAAHGAGALIGMILSGARPNWRVGSLGLTILCIDAVAGLLFMPLGHIGTLWQGVALIAPLGLLTGFIMVVAFSWMQRRVPPQMMGRAMSLFMFIFFGLSPLSGPAAGWLLRYVSLADMFAFTGIGLLAIVGVGVLGGRIVQIGRGEAPAPAPAPAN
jgi:MFS family permease